MNLTISKSTPLKPYDRHWQFCTGSGHASLALRKDYCDILKRVHDELGIERVRFHGIFHDDMHTIESLTNILPLPFGKDINERSFRLCGVAFDNLLSCGMKPFVELSFMPKALAKNPKDRGMFYYKPIIGVPRDFDEWGEYIKEFVRYLINRYGAEEVESWYFEVWNEPDLKIAFFRGTQSEYFRLYEVSARAIKSVDAKIPVGGPSTSSSKWVDAFVKFCKTNNVPLDFVSTHQYAGDPLGGVKDQGGPAKKDSKVKLDINIGAIIKEVKAAPKDSILPAFRCVMRDSTESGTIPPDLFAKNAPIVKEQAQGLPVFYTEWNACATFGAVNNDTRKVAAYDVKTSLAIEGALTGSSIWCFCDIFEELHPFPEEFHGGFGLITQSGIPKPVYYALKLLAEAGSQRYELPGALDGEISAAAFKGESDIQIMLTRQNLVPAEQPKAPYCASVELDSEPTSVTVVKIDEQHCNPFALWKEMGSPQHPTAAQVEEIKAKSAPVEEALEYEYKDGVLSFCTELSVNDVYFIKIK